MSYPEVSSHFRPDSDFYPPQGSLEFLLQEALGRAGWKQEGDLSQDWGQVEGDTHSGFKQIGTGPEGLLGRVPKQFECGSRGFWQCLTPLLLVYPSLGIVLGQLLVPKGPLCHLSTGLEGR